VTFARDVLMFLTELDIAVLIFITEILLIVRIVRTVFALIVVTSHTEIVLHMRRCPLKSLLLR
jgi:hypothetical protein